MSQLTDRETAIKDLLHEVAELHHAVWRIVDSDDPDWASWYADWLIRLSELPHQHLARGGGIAPTG